MDSDTNQSEISTVQSASKVDSDIDMKVVSKSETVEEDGSVTHSEKQLESVEVNKILSNSASDSEVNCEVACDEENTQIITGDECIKENYNSGIENMECGSEVLNSNLEKEVMETQAFEIEEKDNEHQNNTSTEEKPAEKLVESSDRLQIYSSEKLDETVVVESDEEMKAEIDENARTVVEVTKVENMSTQEKNEVLEKDFVPGDESQATTVDITEIESKTPNSPDDLFASQSLGDTVKQNSENSLVDYEDFIPSSLPSQSEKHENDEVNHLESASVSTPQKRKMIEDDKDWNDAKVPRLEVPLVTIDTETSDNKTVEKEQKEIEVIENNEAEKPTCSREAVKTDIKIQRSTSQERDILTNETVVTEGDERINKDQKELGCPGESSNGIMTSKNSRKSVEIIFSSFENADKQEPFVKPQNLPVVPEENGEEYAEDSEMENFRLQMSLSPSQVTQSFTEADVPKDDKEVSNLDAIGKTSNGDTTSSNDNLSNSHHISKLTSELNCYTSKGDHQKIPDTVTVDDTKDVHISSPDEKNSNDIVVLKTVGNCSVSKSDNDSDVTVLLDKTEDSDKSSNSESSKHQDMNGTTLLKRKHPESDADAEKLVVLDEVERIDTNFESDTRKRSRLVNLPTEEKSTPDITLLVSNKGKFQSTPNDYSRATPMNASISTVDSASVSAGKVHDHEDSSFPLRVVKRTYALHVRLHVHDDLRQVQSIEMVQCQNMEDYVLTNTVTRDTSGGSAADESRNSSPSSVMSLGPFSLKTQSWRLSTSSTSTTSSGHSNIGVKSKSDDWHFTAPMKPAPSRNNRLRNVQYSSEFERDLFELAERTLYVDETESKLSSFLNKPTVPPVLSCAPTTTEVLDGIKDIPQTKSETQEPVVETPKSTKKLSRGSRYSRNRTLVSKPLKEVTEEEASFQQTPEKDTADAGESSNSQRKPRKPPSRASKRTGRSTPSTPVTTEESKAPTPTAPSSGRSRRNRTDQVQLEKTESSSHESSHVYDWDAESCFAKLVPEAPVFARWTDKKYYPGRIKEELKDGRWVIEFDDKTVKPLKEEFIIPINILTKGQIVFAYDGDEYEQGFIDEFKLKDGEVHYGVDLANRKLFVPRSRLFMTEDQARYLQEAMDPKSPTTSSPTLTTVSCDNIVHHKRPRSTRVLFGNASPSVSGVAKTAKRPSHDNSCSSSVSDSNDKGPTLVLDEVVGVDPEVPSSFPESLHTPSVRGKGPGRIKSKSRTARRNTPANHTIADTQELNKLHEILGPIPMKGSKMFSGKCFLLTHSVVRPIDYSKITSLKSVKKSDLKSSSEWEASSDSDTTYKIPYVKEHLKQQLEAGDGTVYENFEDVPKDQYQNCYLVTNRPSLTAKYILCLANGIQIIRHVSVVLEARGSSCPFSRARLSSGWDLEGQCYVSQEATVRTRKQKPLNKKKVGIVNESQTFVKFWKRILELLGASVTHISPGSPEQDRQIFGADVILTDSTCPPEVQDRAREWSIPLVSTVWVTQSLINWRIRPFTGHPHYRYDYCASE